MENIFNNAVTPPELRERFSDDLSFLEDHMKRRHKKGYVLVLMRNDAFSYFEAWLKKHKPHNMEEAENDTASFLLWLFLKTKLLRRFFQRQVWRRKVS